MALTGAAAYAAADADDADAAAVVVRHGRPGPKRPRRLLCDPPAGKPPPPLPQPLPPAITPAITPRPPLSLIPLFRKKNPVKLGKKKDRKPLQKTRYLVKLGKNPVKLGKNPVNPVRT